MNHAIFCQSIFDKRAYLSRDLQKSIKFDNINVENNIVYWTRL